MEYRINDDELIYMIRENDDIAVNTIFSKYKPIIMKVCSSYYDFAKTHGVEFCDLVQEGNISLYKAYSRYDEYKDNTFFTYFLKCLTNHLNSYCRDISVKKHNILNGSIPINLDMNIDKYINKEYDYISYEDEFVYIKNMLTFKNSLVFELRYNGFSYKEISKLLDIPISTVDGRLSKIRVKLKEIL
ncbi:MAG: sigma-70 family RNA polymerase sigma factor [Bacilli bacterium]|nr:sigma-70 family RNA polymerase sigma factor [Bacilli bacterium]MBQ6539035.1 sigma-70 family RNA polymerase sigma factor [Bacilli bacterium]